jgi:hypothetical protein
MYNEFYADTVNFIPVHLPLDSSRVVNLVEIRGAQGTSSASII